MVQTAFRYLNYLLNKGGFQLITVDQLLKQTFHAGIGRLSNYRRLDTNFDDYLKKSKSQAGQDWLVLELLGVKRSNGFFVEFGAVNGVQNSNTYYLEKELGWSGIVSEPAKKWHEELHGNRSCAVDERCVYRKSGDFLEFIETGQWMGGNTLVQHKDDDGKKRKVSNRYRVESISLNDLLREHNAPVKVDFISIDTEGSEYEILKNFDFDKYKFSLMLIEHGCNEDKRSSIRLLLESKGYHWLPISDDIAGVDDWYALPEVFDVFRAKFNISEDA